jgi:hypothetical protein
MWGSFLGGGVALYDATLFLEDENIFQKSARVVVSVTAIELQPREPIFEKCSHLREKGGVLISPGFVWWFVWAESPIQI